MDCYLAQGELVRLDGEKAGVEVRCTRGTIWLTCGDGRDYLLSPGRSFTIAAGQIIVAEALQDAVCECSTVKPMSSVTVSPRPVIRFATCHQD